MLKDDVSCLAQRERPSEPSATTANHASGTSGMTEATRSTQAKLQAYKEAITIHKKKAQGSLANDYRHRYTGTGVDNRTTGTGRHRKNEDGAARGEILTTTRRGVGTTTTNGRGGDRRAQRRRTARGRLRRRSLDEGETRPARGLTTRSRGRRRRRGCSGTLDERGRRTRTARRRDERHDDRERREDDDDDDWGRRGGDEGSWQRLHGCEDGVEHAAAMTMTEAAPRDDEPGDRRDVDDENERRRRRWTAEGFGWRGSDAEDDLAAAMPEVEMATSAGALARRKGLPEWVPTRPRERRAEEGDGTAGRRVGEAGEAAGGGTMAATPLDDGGNAPPAVTARNGGQAVGEEAAARPREVVARPANAQARRQRRLEAAGGTGERGRARTECRSRERPKTAPEEVAGGINGENEFYFGMNLSGRDKSTPLTGISSPRFEEASKKIADFDWVVALEDGTLVPELLIVHIFGVNLIQVTHFMLCVDISLSVLGYHACHYENIMLVIYF
uniref:OSJNBa0013A04.4 protein n=1 Tax=Oryza sativa subsp. japonica TaxID=39947 RepID=Q7X638_ORYSJ|nr:OSJNBa0042D13.22 [Oryza sativa Japonica Group]CAE05167.2 OSJNBa0013A04.4 [Oryza sativa Japonica Group]